MGAHSLFGPSSYERVIHCPPSVRAAESAPEAAVQDWTIEGTLGHSLAELYLRAYLDFGGIPPDYELDTLRSHRLWSKDLEDAALQYVEVVKERFDRARAIDPTAQLKIERRVDMSYWTGPGQFGTMDAGIIYGDTLEVIDLKMGVGVYVDAFENEQGRGYALGWLQDTDLLFQANNIRITICQPRRDSVTHEELTRQELLAWGENVLMPAAALALEGKGEFKAGSWCQFCKIKATCKARAAQHLEEVAAVFKAEPGATVVISDDEIVDIVLTKATVIRSWLTAIEEYATEKLKRGEALPGAKLVHGRGRRVYTDDKEVARVLEADGVPASLIYERNLTGITDMEKQLGKKRFKEVLGSLVKMQPGSPKMVSHTDPREPIAPEGEAAALFAAHPVNQEKQHVGREAQDPNRDAAPADFLRGADVAEGERSGQAEVQLPGADQEVGQGSSGPVQGGNRSRKAGVRK